MMKLSGHTKPYAVLGHPIGHTLSPVMHNASFESLGKDAIYLAFDVTPSRLMDVLPVMRDMGFGGVNLTVPLKQVAFEGLSVLDTTAKVLGAVNTVEFQDSGEIKGHNTDGSGFILAVEDAFGKKISGLRVFVLGVGGAGRAVALTCALEGASHLAVTDMDPGRIEQVKSEIEAVAPKISVDRVEANPEAWTEASLGADLVVQATPVGMKQEDRSLLGPEAFKEGQLVFDLIYMYPETAFMQSGQQSNARTENGLGMLLHQGAKAFSIWTGEKADTNAMRRALEAEVYKM